MTSPLFASQALWIAVLPYKSGELGFIFKFSIQCMTNGNFPACAASTMQWGFGCTPQSAKAFRVVRSPFSATLSTGTFK